MDHGADCINTGISTMAYLQIINADRVWCYLVLLMVFQIFFYVTLEEYYFGSLDFPMINFVNEGTTGMFCFLLLGVCFGNEFYSTEVLLGLQFYQCFLLASFAIVVIQILVILFKLFRKFKASDVALKNVLILHVNACFLLVIFLSKESVVQTHPKIIMYIFTILYSRVIIPIMIAHIFDSNFDQCHFFPILVSTATASVALLEQFFFDRRRNLIPDSNKLHLTCMNTIYFSICGASFFYFFCYLGSIIRNFARVLGVNILTINPPMDARNKSIPLDSPEDLESQNPTIPLEESKSVEPVC